MNGNQPGPRQYIHYDPERVDYSVTPDELARLETAASSLSKDACLVLAPLGVACLLNAVSDTKAPFELTLALFLNYLIGAVALALAVIFGIAWYRTRTAFTNIVRCIKQKPKMQITIPAAVNVGSLPAAELGAPEQAAQARNPQDAG